MTELEINKINNALALKFNFFHADLLTRAIQDEKIRAKDYANGYIAIEFAEYNDDDEFVPKGWENV